jgi:hypothetical protein
MTMTIHHRYTKTLLALLILLPAIGFGQVTVTGQTCAIPGTVYQYLISGPWDSASTMQVCLTGGLTADSNQTCTSTGKPRAAVVVTWDSAGTMTLQVTSSKGNSTITVTVINPLSGGTIDSATGSQSVGYDSVPAQINCSVSSGGSCSPSYNYQWQQSTDMLIWQNISGATGQNLSLSQGLVQAVFIRRQVTEMSSGTIAYSSVAVVDVGPPPPGTSSIRGQINVQADFVYARPIPNLKLF